MENSKKLKVNKIDFYASGVFLLSSILSIFVVNMLVFNLSFSSEIMVAFLLNTVNFLIVIFFQHKFLKIKSFVIWGLVIKAVKHLLLVTTILILFSGIFFENHKFFILFFMGFFVISLIIEFVLLNLKRKMI